MNDYLPTIFDGLSKPLVDQALEIFQTVDVPAGAVVIEEGEVDSTMAIVYSGELRVHTGNTLLGRAGAGAMIGEIALFGEGLRTASVTAAVDSKLLVLDAGGFAALREGWHPVAATIEEHALHTLTNRLREVGDRIAALAYGEERAVSVPGPGFFDRVASAFGSGGIMAPPRMNAAEVLGRSPLFHGVPEALLAEVATHFTPIGVRQGHVLCTEGERGEDWFVVADGEIDVLVATANDRVEPLARLQSGDAFGTHTLKSRVRDDNAWYVNCQ